MQREKMKKTLFLFLILGLCLPVSERVSWAQTADEMVQVAVARGDSILKDKSTTGALLRSVAIPGWGQFYNRKYLKSGLVFGAETTFITLAAIEWGRMNKHKKNFQNPDYPDRYWEFEQFQFYEDRRNLFLWITAGIVFLSMFDAYVDAHLYNFDREEVRDLSISLVPEAGGGSDVRLLLSIRF